jgi:hypothetical protein
MQNMMRARATTPCLAKQQAIGFPGQSTVCIVVTVKLAIIRCQQGLTLPLLSLIDTDCTNTLLVLNFYC